MEMTDIRYELCRYEKYGAETTGDSMLCASKLICKIQTA